jgi:hypothetical protein
LLLYVCFSHQFKCRCEKVAAKKYISCSASGWKIFAKDNNLKVGDACTFELLPTSSIVTFIVHIFKD